MKIVTKLSIALLSASCLAGAAQAVTILPQSALTPSTNYYTNNLGTQAVMTGGGNAANVGGVRNDDGFRGPLSLGFTLDFYGGSYSQFWANNNGNISFTGGLAQYTPSGPQGASVPVISPFFGDVDTRNSASGVMWTQNDVADQWIITWDQVGYFGQHADLLNSFQLVLRGPDYLIPAGEGQIGFFYRTMEWETGDASGGSGGFGGFEAAVGFGNGQSDGIVLEGSMQPSIAAVVSDHHIWFNLTDDGIPDPTCGVPGTPPCTDNDVVPEPGTMVLLGSGLVGLAGFARKKNRC